MGLKQLEQISGKLSVDIRLTLEIQQNAVRAMRELGLDPLDTDGRELYHALLARVKADEQALLAALGADEDTNVAEQTRLVKAAVKKLAFPDDCWALKASVAKRLLKALPPKKTMKALGYRSVDSLLKRENISEIFGGLLLNEPAPWHKRLTRAYGKLLPGDFERRKVRVVILSEKRWGESAGRFVRQHRLNLAQSTVIGTVYLLPMPVEKLPGYALTTMMALINAIGEIRHHSSYFLLNQVRPDFGEIVADALANGPGQAALIGESPLHWQTIQRFFGRRPMIDHPAEFEPHVTPDDLKWQKAEAALHALTPRLKFWENLDFTGILDGDKPVSLNLMDCAVSYLNQLPYVRRSTAYMRDSLWSELPVRYLENESVRRQVVSQLDMKAVRD